MTKPSQQFLVGISISESPDLERLGLGKEHLAEQMISIARAVLRLDDEIGLVYGGDLRPEGFTWRLFDIALSEHRPPSGKAPEPPRRIYNYMAWPYYSKLAKHNEAQMVNDCHFMRVRPRDAGFPKIPDDRAQDQQTDPPGALVASWCLTRMRELSTYGGHPTLEGEFAPPMQARILLGGRSSGYMSFMPGLFEEFLISRAPPNNRPPIPVFIIGAFGGAAGQLADALLDQDQADDPLTLEFQLKQAAAAGRRELKQLIDHYASYPHLVIEDRYQALRDAVGSLRDAITGNDAQAPGNGLTPLENRALLTSRDEVEIRRLLVKGLKNLRTKDSASA
ncbi:hypothetical protein [Candidatus Thiosymbion oneisti]|uniref:hypothetical protein n=1 Tax=Candidatus Thiosymbion oneisti TaxID=589554 RepID=UPI00105CCE07|nr:hypothetical protein [Candidatus Thiosymbion oneisti]